MDRKSAGDTSAESVHARRQRMRAEARGLRAATPRSEQFRTPEWLDHSFVLPLTAPEAGVVPRLDVPRQSVPHDDDAAPAESPVTDPHGKAHSAYLRPPTREIDFARVIRRSDLGRMSVRAAMTVGTIAVLVLLAYVLTESTIALGMVVVLGLIALGAAGLRIRLTTAPIPYLDHL